MSSPIPAERVRTLNAASVKTDGDYILYWMVAARRTRFHFGLEHAAGLARELYKPLLVLEALRLGYPWSSPRFHRFVIDGMVDNVRSCDRAGVAYYPYVEREDGAGKGLVAALARHACAVVTDDFPCFMIPRMTAAAARQVAVRMEAVDSNGLLPMSAADRAYPTAHAFRRFLQRELRTHLEAFPKANPLSRLKLPALRSLPAGIAKRWPRAARALLEGEARALDKLKLAHAVEPAPLAGGPAAGQKLLRRFVKERLPRYADDRNDLVDEASSGLSAHLHFGHVSSHQVCREVLAREDWSPGWLGTDAAGKRQGWWGLSESAEGFLDQLVTWRELGFNGCRHMPDATSYDSLPPWALETLERHAVDERAHVYTLEQFERAETHDELWNAAQRQLVREGRIHNYLRMLWGKKILEWTEHPREALDVMVELNNKYALDGRDPNSYSGIFWVLGRYDRPWGPERPIFGKVRYMTSQSTARKLDVRPYLRRYAAQV